MTAILQLRFIWCVVVLSSLLFTNRCIENCVFYHFLTLYFVCQNYLFYKYLKYIQRQWHHFTLGMAWITNGDWLVHVISGFVSSAFCVFTQWSRGQCKKSSTSQRFSARKLVQRFFPVSCSLSMVIDGNSFGNPRDNDFHVSRCSFWKPAWPNSVLHHRKRWPTNESRVWITAARMLLPATRMWSPWNPGAIGPSRPMGT